MKCKNCFYYTVCYYHIDEETDMTVNECLTGFKHKDTIIELPIVVGQKVWLIDSYYNIIKEGKVSMLQQKANKSWKFRVSSDGVKDCILTDIGEYVFLSYENAVLALAERTS